MLQVSIKELFSKAAQRWPKNGVECTVNQHSMSLTRYNSFKTTYSISEKAITHLSSNRPTAYSYSTKLVGKVHSLETFLKLKCFYFLGVYLDILQFFPHSYLMAEMVTGLLLIKLTVVSPFDKGLTVFRFNLSKKEYFSSLFLCWAAKVTFQQHKTRKFHQFQVKILAILAS